ncbi:MULTISPECIES: SDR family oxidoreductase [Arthrobacter]|uniref:SDR family NAD(P)-dependent oxidoreductase n=1 Tax=Arthrobacter sunyaminii TaxID=2816859 RepID=A0A975PDD1_9MICC|nr:MULTISPECIES: SDR family NAD(P)-dependent oxidoreductase [Arthrobacter]MBO0907056.1 SDR family NAD(P)-dependent oxidoreductase [Arthrobacter sunyaminii]QWQ34687.1 SDR family NAD(P)-dependent oxidoreductase [Arthrobacter sunyaminii]
MSSAEHLYNGKTAVITGGGSGLGEGLVRHAAALGMNVVVADINEAAATKVADDIVRAGGNAVALAVDVRDPEQVDSLAEASYRIFKRVDLLVNNAGIEQFGYLWDTPVANWRRILDINVSGVFHGVRSFVPRMISAGGRSSVWNTASVGAVTGISRQGPYLATKHAVLGLTEALKLDMDHAGHDISVAAVLPAAVSSRIFSDAGTVLEGDLEAAEGARRDMMTLLPTALDPLDAARAIFDQAAAGEFYLLSQPGYVAAIMADRGLQLTRRSAPQEPRRHSFAARDH